MKYEYSFKEVNYGGVEIESDHEPNRSDVVDAIMNGKAEYDDVEYEDIKLESPKPVEVSKTDVVEGNSMSHIDRVLARMDSEYKSLEEKVSQMSGKEAINHAYEITIKKDLVQLVEDMNLSPKQAKALCSETKKPLEYLYQEWLGADCSYMDVLRDNISDTVTKIEQIMQRNKSRER